MAGAIYFPSDPSSSYPLLGGGARTGCDKLKYILPAIFIGLGLIAALTGGSGLIQATNILKLNPTLAWSLLGGGLGVAGLSAVALGIILINDNYFSLQRQF